MKAILSILVFFAGLYHATAQTRVIDSLHRVLENTKKPKNDSRETTMIIRL